MIQEHSQPKIVVGSNVWPVSNFAQQLLTTRNAGTQQHATGCVNGRNMQNPADTIVPINTFAFKPIQQDIVKAVLENINPNKAQGCDFILPRTVKACSSFIEKPFCDLLNSIIISSSQIPDAWKCGQITPLHKKRRVFIINVSCEAGWYLDGYGSWGSTGAYSWIPVIQHFYERSQLCY